MQYFKYFILGGFFILLGNYLFAQVEKDNKRTRARDIGIEVGVLDTGELNSITDVPGVKIGHTTIIRNDNVRTGVTAILPHSGNIYQKKVPAAIHLYNAYGKLTGYSQVAELGNIETPIVLTNTLSVGTAMTAVVKYSLQQKGNENVRSVNAVVGETNDGYLNDIRGMHVTENDVLAAIQTATSGHVSEGSVGAGTGTAAFGYKGGIDFDSSKPDGMLQKLLDVSRLTNLGWKAEIALKNGIKQTYRHYREQSE